MAVEAVVLAVLQDLRHEEADLGLVELRQLEVADLGRPVDLGVARQPEPHERADDIPVLDSIVDINALSGSRPKRHTELVPRISALIVLPMG